MFGIEEKDWNKDSASELGKHVIELILLVSVCAPRLADLCHLRGQPSRLSGLLPKSTLPETTFYGQARTDDLLRGIWSTPHKQRICRPSLQSFLQINGKNHGIYWYHIHVPTPLVRGECCERQIQLDPGSYRSRLTSRPARRPE